MSLSFKSELNVIYLPSLQCYSSLCLSRFLIWSFMLSYTFVLLSTVLWLLFVRSVAQCPSLCNHMDCIKPGFPVHHQLPELAQTHVHWLGDAIQPSHPLSSPSPPAFNLSSIRVFSSELVHRIRRPKYCSFSINPSNEYLGLISFRMDWLDLLAVQGTLQSLLQHHSSKASILCSAFFLVQLSHPTWPLEKP